ncbi:hypothetical protein BDQ17DRAFT_59122 [Cyathus striatus]|nr:hypothetical protein BDQ17DRAFT_59122 [Cyathus striatus]
MHLNNSSQILPSDVSTPLPDLASCRSLPPLIPSNAFLQDANAQPPRPTFEASPNPIPGVDLDRPSLMATVPYLCFPLSPSELNSPLFFPECPGSCASALELQAVYNKDTKKSILKLKSDSTEEDVSSLHVADVFVVGSENWKSFATAFHAATADLHSTYPLRFRHPIPNFLNASNIEDAVTFAISRVLASERKFIAQKYKFPFADVPRPRGYYHLLSKISNDRFTADWVPHPLSSEETASYRKDTEAWITRIRQLELFQSTLGKRDARVEDELYYSRIEYRVRFGRIFRVNDLPTEVLTNILRYSIWAAADPREGVNWRLWTSWVCQRWRTTVLGDSTLWNAIWFRDPPHFERSFTWLDRAGTAPLDVRFNDTPTYKFTPEEMDNLLNKILLKLSTIRMLIVIVGDWKVALTIIDRLKIVGTENIPVIFERFELHRDGPPLVERGPGYELEALREPIPLFGGAVVPTLNYFSINGIHIDWTKSYFKNLTTIDIRRISSERAPSLYRFREMLASSPTLRKLILDGAGPGLDHNCMSMSLSPIVLSELKVLVFANFNPSYGLYILSQFQAPNVVDLTLMDFDGFDYGPFYLRLSTCFPRVQLLTFWNAHSNWTDRAHQCMIKWLDALPSVTYLRMSRIREPLLNMFLYDAKTLAYASSESSRKVLCPKLRVIEFHGLDSPSGPDLFIKWVSKRREIGCPIQKVYILKKLAITFKNHQYNALIATGVSISILPEGGITPEEAEITGEECDM